MSMCRETGTEKERRVDRKRLGMHRRINAYFTVEAALLFPFVTGVILFIIYLWFFQYDRCLQELDAGALALRGSAEAAAGEGKEKLLKWLEQEEQKINTEKYIAWEQGKVKMKLEKDVLRVEREGSVVFPFAGISFWSTDNFWKTKTVFENRMISPVVFVRTLRKIAGGK